MLEWVTNFALIMISFSFAISLYRVIAGPTNIDRAVALDNMSSNVVAFIIIFSIKYATRHFIDAMMVIAILSFIGTIAFAKYLATGRIIDKKRGRKNAR
ncbi:Na(+)/H(+) antiporter subunit F [candidate division KSB1 bacterium]|nr:Na(+)/H(+) antiporter subunit F [candidate division KSB1 bacterium]